MIDRSRSDVTILNGGFAGNDDDDDDDICRPVIMYNFFILKSQ